MSQQPPDAPVDERRGSMRFLIQAPAVVTVGGREIWAFTRNISTTGISFRIPADETAPSVGEIIDFVVKIPPTFNSSRHCFINGRGRTIRVDRAAWDETGVVVETYEYEICTEPVH